MGNLGSGELLVIFFVALIILGPNKLPDAARQMGRAINEVRRVSGGFQREMREAMKEPIETIDDFRRTANAPFAANPPGDGPVRPAQRDQSEAAPDAAEGTSIADSRADTGSSGEPPDTGERGG